MPKLGVNIDHIATLREARREGFPDPTKAARICEANGADSIVCHLRQDRRHIQDEDIFGLRRRVRTRLNLEMSVDEEIVKIALRLKPDQATLVPERRQELTTEGGLDVVRYRDRVAAAVKRLSARGILVSLFIDPERAQVDASKNIGAPYIELHTGSYANAKTAAVRKKELKRLKDIASYAESIGLGVNAGHGLNYDNVKEIARIPAVEELNIGFSIVAESVFVGLPEAVRRMKVLIG